jgi:hypothetical protein
MGQALADKTIAVALGRRRRAAIRGSLGGVSEAGVVADGCLQISKKLPLG